MSTDLLERRAERGSPRGSANIWAELQAPSPTPLPPKGSAWAFRLAVGVLAAAVGFGVFGITNSSTTETVADVAAPIEDSVTPSEDTLPEPYLVEGLSLAFVAQPTDPEFDADDLLGEPGNLPPPKSDAMNDIVIFARSVDDFDGPILGVEVLDDGTTEAWSANLSSTEFASLNAELAQVDGQWTVPADSGLVQVAQFQFQPELRRSQQWDFEFVDTDSLDSVVLHANPLRDGGQWENIATYLSTKSDTAVVETVDLEGIDRPGIRVEREPQEKVFEGEEEAYIVDLGELVLWDDGDFAYSLDSRFSPTGTEACRRVGCDELIGYASVDLGVSRIESSERNVWVTSVANSTFLNRPAVFTAGSVIFGLLASLTVVAAAYGIRRFAYRPQRGVVGAPQK